MEDDYGDEPYRRPFRKLNPRKLIEDTVRFAWYKSWHNRTQRGFTLWAVQWQGNADAAETSFFKINSQGLDETEGADTKQKKTDRYFCARDNDGLALGTSTGLRLRKPRLRELKNLPSALFELLFEPEGNL